MTSRRRRGAYLLRMVAGITSTNFLDDAQRERVLAVALDGVRTTR